MISDEAVEAALDELPVEAARYFNAHRMRNVLEAAAPYMQQEPPAASVWDEAANVLYMGNAIGQEHLKAMWERNPYRSRVVTKVGAMDDALRMYQEGVALAVITERTGISYSGLMKAKKDRGIPDRPQRADGTDRSQA